MTIVEPGKKLAPGDIVCFARGEVAQVIVSHVSWRTDRLIASTKHIESGRAPLAAPPPGTALGSCAELRGTWRFE